MFSQCYVLVDYAEWLIAKRFPVQQSRDALHTAADVLLRVRGTDPDAGGGGKYYRLIFEHSHKS
jgi:hypothetical protein